STNVLAALLAGTAILGVFFIWSSGDYNLQRIARQSIPVLFIGILIDLAAGVIIEKRITDLLTSKSVLIMLPAFLATAGALGGILSSRLSTQFHLGLDDATPIPSRTSANDIRSLVAVAIPIFISAAGAAHILGVATNQNAPGFWQLVLIALFGGALALILVVGVAYYSTMAAFRFGLDPDTYGIPMVTSSLDLVGAFTLVIAMMAVGVT
ncbi:MAG: magnesium transporter, partial [Actinomycetota bacterium]|nr:magnesium transporter [Actinomycetota bacterium]